MAVKTYDPGQVAMIVGGKIITGFSEGTFIKASRNEQAYNLKVGVDGEGTRARNRNKSGKFEITLMQSSDSNDVLSAFAAADEASNSGSVPVLLKDASGRTVGACATGWVQKIPDSDFAKETEKRVWVIETDEIDIFVGGN